MEFIIAATKEMVLARVAEYCPADLEFVKRACEFADRVMANKEPRGNGLPYSTHYYSAAYMLLEHGHANGIDVAVLICHDTIEDGEIISVRGKRPVRENDIIQYLSNGGEYSLKAKRVAKGVEALTNFKREEFAGDRIRTRAANFLKATEVFVKDLRVIPYRLYDRMHNMLTLGDKPEKEKQLETALDTLMVLCPFGKSLGMYDLSIKMEDIAFSFLMPEVYQKTKEILDHRIAETAEQMQQLIKIYSSLLTSKKIPHVIETDYLSVYALHKELEANGGYSNRVHNLRVINPIILSSDIEMCFDAERIIKESSIVCRGLGNDYISTPKDNFYQATHTVVHGRKTGAMYQVQVCNRMMSEINHFGLPAYMTLRANHPNRKNFDRILETKRRAIEDNLHSRRESGESYDLSDHLNSEIFGDIITVYTPEGMPIVLPKGSVPHDFSYRLSERIGNHTCGALINGTFINELDGFATVLEEGDCVLIKYVASKLPKMQILLEARSHVKTAGACKKIGSLINVMTRPPKLSTNPRLIGTARINWHKKP